MKSVLLSALIAFASSFAYCASSRPASVSANAENIAHRPFGNNPQKISQKNIRGRKLYYRGHGVSGLVLGIVLGPVGVGLVHLFSHNQTTREKSHNGLIIWVGAVLMGALVWDIIVTKPTLGDILGDIAEVILQGLANNN